MTLEVRTVVILLECSIQDFDAVCRINSPASHLTISVKAMGYNDVRPAIGIQGRLVDLGMDFA